MIHAGVPNAPFGGVGDSGYGIMKPLLPLPEMLIAAGSYDGKFGFDAFSHTRTGIALPTWMASLMSFRYALYNI
jgi:aldehyde dehydrogenase (NAD+)